MVSRGAHHQGRRRMDAHAERSGVPRLLHRPLPLRQRDRVPALCVARGRRRLRAAHGRLLQRHLRHAPDAVPRRHDDERRSAAALPAGGGPTGPATDAAGASKITNEELSLFVQDKWQPRTNLTVQLRPALGRAADARDRRSDDRRRLRAFLSDPSLPLGRHDSRSVEHVAAARRRGVGRRAATASRCVRASAGVYFARQNMLTQVGIGDDQRRAAADDLRDTELLDRSARPRRCGPGSSARTPLPPGQFPLFSGIRVFDKDYENPRIYAFNVGIRAAAACRTCRLRGLHLERGTPPDAVPELQPQRAVVLRSRGRNTGTSTSTAARRGGRSSAR